MRARVGVDDQHGTAHSVPDLHRAVRAAGRGCAIARRLWRRAAGCCYFGISGCYFGIGRCYCGRCQPWPLCPIMQQTCASTSSALTRVRTRAHARPCAYRRQEISSFQVFGSHGLLYHLSELPWQLSSDDIVANPRRASVLCIGAQPTGPRVHMRTHACTDATTPRLELSQNFKYYGDNRVPNIGWCPGANNVCAYRHV